MWLETKGMADSKHYIFILQLLSKEGLGHCKSFCPTTANSNEKEQPNHVWETFESSFRQISSFRNCGQETLTNSH